MPTEIDTMKKLNAYQSLIEIFFQSLGRIIENGVPNNNNDDDQSDTQITLTNLTELKREFDSIINNKQNNVETKNQLLESLLKKLKDFFVALHATLKCDERFIINWLSLLDHLNRHEHPTELTEELHIELIDAVLSKLDNNYSFSHQGWKKTLLSYAAGKKNAVLVARLLSNGADPNKNATLPSDFSYVRDPVMTRHAWWPL